MTLQQLQYIIAVDRFRNFANAAEHCGVAQPTLSKMIAKLEKELDVRIFDRTSRNVEPTSTGEKIVRQAVKTVQEATRISEIVAETRSGISGAMHIVMGTSIAPYLLPRFIRVYGASCPEVQLTVEEMRPEGMFEALERGMADIAVATAGHGSENIFEIPIYEEPFWVYISSECRRRLPELTPELISHESMWVMKEVQCLRESAFSFCKARETGRRVYEAGNIETLVRVVDENGGFTIIPEMHLPMLSERQRENVRPLSGDCLSMRRVSLYIRHDYVRERMLNSVVAALIKVIPRQMLEPAILRGPLRL